jgi:glycosyltransferase involved in cell wall biosynthesis
MTLSIVIPARDEAPKIRRDVEEAGSFLGRHFSSGEIIVVDDGSSDATGRRAREAVVPDTVQLRVIRIGTPRGKGHAIREGVGASAGQFVMFADAGLTVPFENAVRGLQLIREGSALAHGSRWLRESVIRKGQDWDRRIASRVFRWVSRLLVRLPPFLTDTQCGFKVYDGATARQLFAESVIDGFLIDIEIIALAMTRGKTIAEFPVEWTCDRDSRLHVVGSSGRVLHDLLRIRRMVRQQGRRT